MPDAESRPCASRRCSQRRHVLGPDDDRATDAELQFQNRAGSALAGLSCQPGSSSRLRAGVAALGWVLCAGALLSCAPPQAAHRPNILILMSDNHSWNHLSCYGDSTVRTPNIDAIAAEGVRFTHAFCPAPSCTPARAAMLTGQDIWRLEEGANLWGTLPSRFPVYTNLLEEAGYLVGFEGKGWGPGNHEEGGWSRNPAGERFRSFEEFYNQVERGQPFCYWFSSRDPHRPYAGDGQQTQMDMESIQVPPYLPDVPEVRGDIADYYAEVERFDRDVGGILGLLSEYGLEEDTVVIIASDNGWQMPRGLANLYDAGTRLPLVISAPGRFPGGRVVDDFVSLADFAPTILELAGLPIPEGVTAGSLLPILAAQGEGLVDEGRSFVVTGRERHAFVRKGGPGYPSRAIRTREYLYIRNYAADRWPAGDPPLYGDVDAHMLHYPSPTKMYLLQRPQDPQFSALFEIAFAKRPQEELYDLAEDPHQMRNVASESSYAAVRDQMSTRLEDYLRETGDPRVIGGDLKWQGARYFQERDFHPKPSAEAVQALGLAEAYTHLEAGQ